MWHPWRALRSLDHIEVIWAHLDSDLLATTDGRRFIWMDPRQTQAQRRGTIAHELAHIELGHIDGCSGRKERQARDLAARRLIRLDHLAKALKWARNTHELADELWVDVETLTDRFTFLTVAEARWLADALDDQ